MKWLKKLPLHTHRKKVYEITGVEPGILLRIAKEFTNLKGVIDDGWYTSKNGTDVQLYQLICIANAMNGILTFRRFSCHSRCGLQRSERFCRKRSQRRKMADG